MLDVGTAALMFDMPSSALAELGQTFLTLSASATRKSS
jgi:hypothetical protein